jgi:Flp pilus assembly protein TadD
MKHRKKARPTAQPTSATAPPGLSWNGPLSEWLIAVALAGVTFLVYLPALSCDFVNYDDPAYVTENQMVWQGLGPTGLRWAMTAIVSANWHPLTMLSLQLDYELSGLKPFGYHLTNVLLHVANAVLLFRVLRAATGMVNRSAVVALLFALHPLHVESVVWVSERKDLLSTLFGLLALRVYVSHAAVPSWRRLGGATVLLALSLLSKPMWVTFPFLLLLLDWWPLGRTARGISWRRLVVEKWPLFALSAGCVAITVATQHRAGATSMIAQVALPLRFGNAATSYVQYLRQAVLPLDLAAFYPHPGASLNLIVALGAAIVVLAISGVAYWQRDRVPYLFVGWNWYLGMLVPVIGLVQVGMQARADRYTYMPLVGIFLAAVWAASDLLRRARLAGFATGLAAVAALLCGMYTWAQLSHWSNSVTLWQQACAVSPHDLSARRYLGTARVALRDYEGALKEFDRALALAPDDHELHLNRGLTLMYLDRGPEAEQALKTARKLAPQSTAADQNLGNLLLIEGRLDEAAECYSRAAFIDDDPVRAAAALLGLGKVRFEQERPVEAEEYLNDALHKNPNLVETYDALARVYARSGRFSDAVAMLDRGLSRAEPTRDAQAVQVMNNQRALFISGRFKP